MVLKAKSATLLWRIIPLKERVVLIQNALMYFDVNREQITIDISRQMGKPIQQSQNEIKGFFERANYLCDQAPSILSPEFLPPKEGFERRIEHVPLGVILIIAPWNYPLLTAVNGIVTALLAGNSVILKHSSVTPEIGKHFALAFKNLKPDLLQNILAEHSDLERAIRECEIDHVVFTGSVEGGRKVQMAASHRFIDCNLELGGKDGAYVAEDADLEKAVEDLVDGAMYNAGQSCCGIERVYVHEKLYDNFVSRAKILAEAYVLGDPMNAKTSMGPLSSAKAAVGMLNQITQATDQGAQVLTGGKIRKIESGTFFEPTILINTSQLMEVVREENFGPILPIIRVASDDEAIRLINDSPYGLTSAIYTQDLNRANRFAIEAETGTVFLNRCDYLDPALPWTGVRNSGRGSTLSQYGFYALTRRKAIHFRLPKA